MLKGITIQLYEKTETGKDDFGAPIYAETPIDVENVLVGEPNSDEITETLNRYGRKVIYIMGIPKGDQHDWENKKVSFFGQTFMTIGIPVEGIEELIPLSWNKKVKVERYGESQSET